MALRAVAWDVDGTLVDSEPLHHFALVDVTRGFGVDLSDLPEERFRGVHMGDVWAALRCRLPPALDQAEWLRAVAARYLAGSPALRPRPGAARAVSALVARGVPQCCVSNSHRAIVDANLEALGFSGAMAFTIALDDVAAGKPNPEPYAVAAQRFGLAPAEVLAVEDSAAGLESAAAAGLAVALCGPAPVPERWSARVTRVADVAGILSGFEILSRRGLGLSRKQVPRVSSPGPPEAPATG